MWSYRIGETLVFPVRIESIARDFRSSQQTEQRKRVKHNKLFEEAYERCHTAPMEGVSFTLENFTAALDK